MSITWPAGRAIKESDGRGNIGIQLHLGKLFAKHEYREQHACGTFIFRPGETVYLLVHKRPEK